MRRQKVTIYETIDHHGFKTYWCCSRRHYHWKDIEKAKKCCNGWTPVFRPSRYSSGALEDWGHWYDTRSQVWVEILIPDFLTDEIGRLRELYRAAHPQRTIDVPVWDWDNSSEETQ